VRPRTTRATTTTRTGQVSIRPTTATHWPRHAMGPTTTVATRPTTGALDCTTPCPTTTTMVVDHTAAWATMTRMTVTAPSATRRTFARGLGMARSGDTALGLSSLTSPLIHYS